MRGLRGRLGGAIVVLASVAALVSAVGGAWVGIPKLDDWRGPYGPLPGTLRDDPVGHFLGFDVESWDALREALRPEDRYVVVARGPTRFEVRNYAAYTLLPAVQVTTQENADVVVFYGTGTPDERCTRIGLEVCILRRERS